MQRRLEPVTDAAGEWGGWRMAWCCRLRQYSQTCQAQTYTYAAQNKGLPRIAIAGLCLWTSAIGHYLPLADAVQLDQNKPL